jgi:hypothetical protein
MSCGQLESAAKNLLHQIAVNESEVDSLCSEVDKSIADSKKVCEEVGARIEEREYVSRFACDHVTKDCIADFEAPSTYWHSVVEKVGHCKPHWHEIY